MGYLGCGVGDAAVEDRGGGQRGYGRHDATARQCHGLSLRLATFEACAARVAW